MEIPIEIAKKPIDNNKIYFPEFENYKIFEGKTKIEKQEGGLVQAFKYVGNGLGNMASFFGDKYQQYNIGSKIKDGGAATLKGLYFAGNYLYELSKPAMKYASDKAIEGVGYLYRQKNEANNTVNVNNNDNAENKEEIIIEEDEGQDSNLFFKIHDESPIQNELSHNNQDYPTLSQINNINNESNNEIKNDESNISAAPLNEINLIINKDL